MRRNVYLPGVALTACLTCGMLSGQDKEGPVALGLSVINVPVLKAQLGILAADWMEGRQAGEKGEILASEYIASMLQYCGVKPGGDFIPSRSNTDSNQDKERSYFQNFILLKTSPGDLQVLKVRSQDGDLIRTVDFTYNVDFTFRPSYPPVETDAPVIFVGYGFKNEKLNYSDFDKTDLKGKFLLKIGGVPAFVSKSLNQDEIINSVRESEKYIRDMGAAGILEFTPTALVLGNPPVKDFINPSPSESNPARSRPSARYSFPGDRITDDLIRINISVKTANEILKGNGDAINDYLKKADSNLPFTLPVVRGKSVYLKTDVRTSQVSVRNVVGIIEGNDPDQVIVLGAHYDHMGIWNGYIWNGADDNGSGTVGVMTLARAIMATGKKPEKTIIIALWTAEEEGLLGSRYYVRNLSYPLKNLKLNANFDMISRYIADDNPDGVVMTYTKSFPKFRNITESNLKKYGIDLKVDFQPSDDPPGGTDHRSFVEAGVPVIRFKPGHRGEYHTPADEINTIDWDIMEKIVRINFADIWELANSSW